MALGSQRCSLCGEPMYEHQYNLLDPALLECPPKARAQKELYEIERGEQGWVGVDLDGTLAEYNGWQGPEHIGKPIPTMVERVKAWLAQGKDVRIFTARVWPLGTEQFGLEIVGRAREAHKARGAIWRWCKEQFGVRLPVTCVKDYLMVELWDDRAVQVVPNTGVMAIHWTGKNERP